MARAPPLFRPSARDPGRDALPLSSEQEIKIVHSELSKYLAELVGTYFVVVTIGCNVLSGSVGAALSIGSMLMVMTFSLGPVSGAHFNPAVTLAVLLSGRNLMTLRQTLGYVLAQLLGGCLAGCSYALICGSSFTLGPVGKSGAFSAGTVEAIYTAALCYVVLNVTTTEKLDGNQFFGMAIGFTVISATLAIGGISGCSLNPAVSLGAALASAFTVGLGSLYYLPLYFCTPLVGSVLAFAAFYCVRKVDEYAPRTTRPARGQRL